MAADWIKMRVGLKSDPKVIYMADYLAGQREFMDWLGDPVQRQYDRSCYEGVTRNVTRALCVTALLDIWGACREQGRRENDDLVVDCCTENVVDALCDVPCFGAAMAKVGWLIVTESETAIFPKFFADKESPAVRHAMSNADRQRKYRNEKRNEKRNEIVTKSNGRNVTKCAQRRGEESIEEKRKEEDKSPRPSARPEDSAHCASKLAASEAEVAFAAFWKAYPRKVGKADGRKSYDQAVGRIAKERGVAAGSAREILLEAAEAFAASPAGQDGPFVPHPATWLNQGRYDDDRSEWLGRARHDGDPRGNLAVRDKLRAEILAEGGDADDAA